MNILEKIIKDKQQEVEIELSGIQAVDMVKKPEDFRLPLDFKKALSGPGLSIIAEVKKASPSKGLIRADFNPEAIALAYSKAGCDCISVLTEEKYFQGNPQYLVGIRNGVNCPLLRKDFIIDPRQIRESYDLGADAILLIVSILTDRQLQDFSAIATQFGLTCLVEVHSHQELERALNLDFQLIGINNRNLTTFETNISQSIALIKSIPESVVTVSESGIQTPTDCLKLQQNGFNAILVGETLMRQPDPGAALSELMSLVR